MLDNPQPLVVVFSIKGEQIDLSSFVQSININNSINTPVGSCQITFNPVLNMKGVKLSNTIESDFRKLLLKNSVIMVKMNRDLEPIKFLGFIDHIPERITSNNTSTGKTITINCSMLLPKMLVKDNIVNAPQLHTIDKIKSDEILKYRSEFFQWQRGLLASGKSAFAGKPKAAVSWILNNAPATNALSIKYGGAEVSVQSFVDTEPDYTGQPAIDLRFLKKDFLYAPELSVYSGTVLNYILSCIDRDFYEVYFDATVRKDGFPLSKMVIRPKPFTYKALDSGGFGWFLWENLPTYEIGSELRLEEALGQSDFEVKNFFQCYFNMDLIASADSNLAKYGYQFPIINIEGVKKYGLRDLVIQSRLMNQEQIKQPYEDAIKNKEKVDVHELASKELKDPLLDKRNKLMYWHGFPNFESGQLTVKGGDYRIGNKLFYRDKKYFDEENGKYIQGVEYYIESVADRYRYPNFYSTTLGLTRGAPKGFVADWFGKHEADFIKIDKLNKEAQVEPIDTKDYSDQVKQFVKTLKEQGIKNVE